jgi:WD40 repeat protein
VKHKSRMTARSDLRDLVGRFKGLIPTAMRAAIAQTVDPVRRSACLPRAPIRRRSASLLVALLVGIAWAVKLASSSAFAGPLDQDGAESFLPPRALLRIGTDLLRADSGIAAIAFSPDGRIAAAEGSGPSPRVVLFDVRSGRRTKVLTARGEQMEWVECLAFSPDGTKLLWGEHRGKVALWDLTGDRLLFRDELHDRAVSDVRFSPDGKLLASAGGDAIQLRRVTTPDEAAPGFATRTRPPPEPRAVPVGMARGPEGIACLAFTPDGSRIVAGTFEDATILVWHTATGRLLRKIPGAHGNSMTEQSNNPSLNCVAVTPDGQRIMSIGQTTKPRAQTKLWPGSINAIMSEVRFWDIATGQKVADYHSDLDEGFGYGALSPDGRLVAVSDCTRLRIVDAATGRTERAINLPGSSGDRPVFSPDGTLVALPMDNTIALFEVSTGRRLRHDASTPVGTVITAAWSPAADRVVTLHGDGLVRVWDAATGKLCYHNLLAHHIAAAFVSFSSDGKLMVAAGRADDPRNFDKGMVVVYETASGRTVREVAQKDIRWGALAPDARMVVLVVSDTSPDTTRVMGIEVESGRTRWINPPANELAAFYPLAGLQFEASGPWFHAALPDGNVIRLNALTGHEQRRFRADSRRPQQQKAGPPHPRSLVAATFSSDGRTMVSSEGEWLCVWDVESGTLRRKFRQPRRAGCNITLAPDGRTLATCRLLYTAHEPDPDLVRLYDIETAQKILSLEPTDGRPCVMAFSPDGTRLFTGTGRGTGIVWDVRREKAAGVR